MNYTATIDGDQFYSADAKYEAITQDNGTRTLVGYPIVWGATTDQPIGGMKHRFSRGSVEFSKPTYALYHHDFSMPLADTESGTLRMKEDIHGYRVEIDVPSTQAGNDTWELVKSGRVRGMSFAGKIQNTEVKEQGVLDVTKFAAHEVTVTPIPRFSATSIAPKVEMIQHAEIISPEEKETAPAPAKDNREQINRLTKLRLAMYGVGRVSAK